METDGAGTMVYQPSLPHNTPFEFAGLTSNNMEQAHEPESETFNFTTGLSEQSVEATTANISTQAPYPEAIAIDARKSVGEEPARNDLAHVTLPGDDAALAANILTNGSTYAPPNGGVVEDYAAPFGDPFVQHDMYSTMVPEEAIVDDPANESDSVIRANMRAYAKLVLPDGDFFITTPKLKVIRDMDCFREYQHELKLAKRAQRELDRYAQEPSMPSQPGDGDQNGQPSSKSSQSLIGRPARALPSNFSEQGGAVAYAPHSDDETGRRRRRKRKILSGKVSSAGSGSIAPASLHPNFNGIYGGGTESQEEIQVLPVHPSIPADIVKISKEHLLFAYNNAEERWELEVLGARCMVNDSQHVRGDIVPLNHDDEIMVVSLTIRFKLPDQRGHSPGISHGTFGESDDTEMKDDDDYDSDLEPDPVIPPLFEFDDLDSENDEAEDDIEEIVAESSAGRKKPKIKLKLKKKDAARKNSLEHKMGSKEKAVKLNLKQHKKKDRVPEEVPVDLEEKVEKGKLPKSEHAVSPTEDVAAPPLAPELAESLVEAKAGAGEVQDKPVQTQMSPPAPPPVIEPGSIFEGVAPEEMPQKRKGPGRPPKNGLISKRDQSFVKRKIKEYEKRGEQPPPMDELVSIVRAENKAKEAAQKAAARGEPVTEVLPSIEYDGHTPMMRQEFDQQQRQQQLQQQQPRNESGQDQSAAPLDLNGRPSSPRPKHVARSPSPIKPETEFTEEEMKKPTMTYVHILDEVLKDHPIGKADLQEIYDRICKRYPYFKYKTTTSGWQSSVRHNLLQHGRFRESGRSGKGRLWAIDYNYDLSKEKKRKLTPPPRPPPQQISHGNYPSNLQGQPPLYGQPNYQTPYGQSGPNGQPQHNGVAPPPGQTPYYSPYGPASQGHTGQYPPSHGQHGSAPQRGHPGVSQARAPQSTPGQQPGGGGTSQSPVPVQAAPPPAAFQVVVDGIMRYRERYLAPYSQNTAAFKFHEDLFKKCTAFVSDIFHGQAASVDTGSFTSEEQRVFNELSDVVNRCKAGGGTPTAETLAPTSKSATPSASASVTNDAVTKNSGTQQPPPPANLPSGSPGQGGNATVQSASLSTGNSSHSATHPGVPGLHGPVPSSLSKPSSTHVVVQAQDSANAATVSSALSGESKAPHATSQEQKPFSNIQPVGEQATVSAKVTSPVPTSTVLFSQSEKGISSLAPAPPTAHSAAPAPSAPSASSTSMTAVKEVSVDVPQSLAQSQVGATSKINTSIPAEDSTSTSSIVQLDGQAVGETVVQPVAVHANKRPADMPAEYETESTKRTRIE